MRSPLALIAERFRRRPPQRRETPPLPASMGDGAEDFQARLDSARERLRRDIPPPPDDEE
jgi:hypothetical protein